MGEGGGERGEGVGGGSQSHQAEKRARRVEMTWHTRPRVDVLADAFESSRLEKVRRADRLSHNVPPTPARNVGKLL